MSTLNDLTLVAMSYKRQMYLSRSLQYWSTRGPKIVVLDCSPDPIDSDIIKGFGTNISYHCAPVSYRERLGMVESKLKNKYVALMADDDFYLPSGLKASIDFLERHDDYSACIGRPVGFGYDPVEGVFGIPGVYDDMNNDYRIVSDDPGLRISEHMGRYMPSTMYAVLRTKNWEKTIEAFLLKEFPVFSIVELQMELATAYQGKSVVLPILGWLKSTELEQTISPDISLQRSNEFHDLWPLNGGENLFRSEFIKIMTDVLCDADKRSPRIVANEIEVAMDSYVAWCNKYFRKTVPYYGAREYIKRHLPNPLKVLLTKCLRILREKQKTNQPKMSLLDLGKHLLDTGTFVDMDELQEIISLVQYFHDPSDGSVNSSIRFSSKF